MDDRLNGLPWDFEQFEPGQKVDIFTGSGWVPAIVQRVEPARVIVLAARTGSRTPVEFAAYDARNLLPAGRGKLDPPPAADPMTRASP